MFVLFPVPRQSSQWGADRHNARSNQQHSNAPFNHAPGTSVRPSVGAWNSDTGPGNNHSAVPQAAAPGVNLFTQPGNNASQSSKVNPNNIWNIPGVAADSSNNSGPGGPDHPNTNTGSVRPIPSATPSVGGGQSTNAPPSNAGASNNDAQQDSFTNIGIWEPTEPKDKDPDSDPKGTRLWAAYMMQSRGSGGHNEDKTMGGKMRVPSFQSIEEMSDSEKKHLLEKLINSHEGWGKTSINQEVSWDETMNVFIPRPESISSDKTHQSDNPESPSSLNDPASFPLMVKHSSTGDNASVPLASPTSKAGKLIIQMQHVCSSYSREHFPKLSVVSTKALQKTFSPFTSDIYLEFFFPIHFPRFRFFRKVIYKFHFEFYLLESVYKLCTFFVHLNFLMWEKKDWLCSLQRIDTKNYLLARLLGNMFT